MRTVVFLGLHWGSASLEAPASSAAGPGRQRCIPRSRTPAKPRAPGTATRDLGAFPKLWVPLSGSLE